MADPVLSPGVKLAWQMAGDLAFREQELAIQPRHILYGICSVEKLLKASEPEGKDDPIILAKPEVERLCQLAADAGVELGAMRRLLRAPNENRITNPPVMGKVQLIRRSPATRQIFETAAQVSRGTSTVDLLHLSRAVLQAHDPAIEGATVLFRQALSKFASDLEAPAPVPPEFSISLDGGLRDLDDSSVLRPLQINETLDASIPLQPQHSQGAIERLAGLSELTWEFGISGVIDSLLQQAINRLIAIMDKAERGVILVRDRVDDDELLLKGCAPAGAAPMISMTSAKRAITEQKGFIWQRGEDLTLSQKESNVESGMYVPLVVNRKSIGVICLDCFCSRQSFAREDLLLVTSFAHQLGLAIANHELQLTLKQNTEVLERLLTNFSPKVRTRLLQRAQMGRLRLGGEQSVVSVLCADIRGFARLTSEMATDDVVSLLNDYFAELTECIMRNDGTIDKFVGDAILAVFGSPEADPQHCRKAVLAGMEMQEAAHRVTERRRSKGEATCEIGVGIHTGEVLHGFIGSPERMEFTIIGDTVNRTARYSDAAKASEVLLSPDVHQRVWNLVEVQQISITTKHEGDLVAYRVQRLRHPA